MQSLKEGGKPMVTQYLLTFQNTHYAVKSEKLLVSNQLAVSVMALPESLGDFCGICLRLEPADFQTGCQLLRTEQIPVEGMYEIIIDSQGERSYRPWMN